ncbi:MAG: MFS transporter, partial [Agromyces sp.]
PVLILQFAQPRSRAFAMSIWGSFFGTAFAMAGLVAPALNRALGVSAVFLGHAVFSAVLALVLWRALPRVPGDGPQPHSRTEGFVAAHRLAYTNRRSVLPGAIFIFHTALYAVFVLYIPAFVDSSAREPLLVLMPLVSILGTLVSGLLTGRWLSPAAVLTTGFGALVVCIVAIALTAQLLAFAIVLPLLLMLCAGFIQGAAFSLIPALTSGPEHTAQANGVLMQLGNLGTLVGPPLFAFAMTLSPTAPTLPYSVAGVALCAGGAAVSVLALRITGVRVKNA